MRVHLGGVNAYTSINHFYGILYSWNFTSHYSLNYNVHFIIDSCICAYVFMCSCIHICMHVFYICDICAHRMYADFILLIYLWLLGQRWLNKEVHKHNNAGQSVGSVSSIKWAWSFFKFSLIFIIYNLHSLTRQHYSRQQSQSRWFLRHFRAITIRSLIYAFHTNFK